MALGGKKAARLAAHCESKADAIYHNAADLLSSHNDDNSYAAAFFGHRPNNKRIRRRLREAWRESLAIARLRGTIPVAFDHPQPGR